VSDVKLKPCARREGIWESERQLHSFFTSAADENEWTDLPPNCYTPSEERVLVPTERGLCGPHKAVWTLLRKENYLHRPVI